MFFAVVGTLDRAAERNAVQGKARRIGNTRVACLFANVNVDHGLTRGNGIGNIGHSTFENRGERDIFALIFHAEHFHQGEVQPACRTGKHRSDIFARNAVVVLRAETGVTLGMIGVRHRLIGINGIHREECEVRKILCKV